MSNVVDLKAFKNKPKEKSETDDKDKEKPSVDFNEIAKANAAKAERLAKQRAKDNQSVKRSYRLNSNDPNNKR